WMALSILTKIVGALHVTDDMARTCARSINRGRGYGMSGEEKTAGHERAAVAYAHRLTTNAGIIWREITGQDIGIDAILELPYPDKGENALRGFALLQVKSRSDASTRDQVSAKYKKRHHLYWLTQRLPVLLCVVEPDDLDGFTTAGAGYWIDYKALAPDEYSITPTTDSRWTV